MTSTPGDANTAVAENGKTAVLQFQGINKTFLAKGTPVRALMDVNLSIESNEFTTLIGPSGCGKSTLLRLAAGLSYATSGRTTCYGNVVNTINKQVGFISQENDLFPWMTLIENVEFPLEAQGVAKSERRERALAMIDMVGLSGFENRYPYELSGGMQKRASIIRTMVYEPKIVLMDEPFGPLDAQTRLVLQNELLKIWSARKMTIVFVTHDLVEAIALSDRVVVMTKRPGRIKAVVPIQLARPRNVFEIHEQQGFNEAHHELWRMMQSEIAVDLRQKSGQDVPVSVEEN